MVPCVGGRASLHMCHLPTRQSLRFPDRWSILPVPLIATASSVAVMLPRIVPTGRAAGYARQRVIKRVPKIVKAKRPAAKTNKAAEDQSAAAAPKEWKFTGWVSTKRDIKAAVDECVQNIRPKFGDVRVPSSDHSYLNQKIINNNINNKQQCATRTNAFSLRPA